MTAVSQLTSLDADRADWFDYLAPLVRRHHDDLASARIRRGARSHGR